jgi:uncharacterized membrane protein YedE/YeeE
MTALQSNHASDACGTHGKSCVVGKVVRALWNPFVVGALIGVLSWVVFVVVDKPIGMSTAISEIAGAAATPIVGSEAVHSNPYWAKFTPSWNYGLLFLVGTFLGALASSLVSRRFKIETVPQVWAERFGASRAKRLGAAFAGGVLVMFGARLAGGCTSGHGISQTLQLAVVGWVFFVSMFASGLLTAWLMFRKPAAA